MHARPKTTADAIHAKLKAARLRRVVQSRIDAGMPTGRDTFDLVMADSMERAAGEALKMPKLLERGAGGELVPPSGSEFPMMAEFLEQPADAINLQASIERVELAESCGALNMALDAAQDAKASSAQEKMLMHQMAAIHKAAMTLLAKSTNLQDTVEQARLANTGARMMDTYQRGMLTLQRVRSGGRQVVTVQHVQVNGGGQAVIAGALNTGGKVPGRKVKR